jgi:hypothetical protein
MRAKILLPVLLLGLIAASSAPIPEQAAATITGDYVEARTASVFAGPCHYNGELVTDGKQAILAWNITSGSWNGVDLAGVRAMASINCQENLSDTKATRKAELVVDSNATNAQVAAATDLIRSRAGAQLGQISGTKRATISFTHDADGYVVNADGFAAMTVHPMPNNECCTQPHLVWYEPLTAVEHRKVGYTEVAGYSAGSNGDQWERSDENSAFYGTFTLNQK